MNVTPAELATVLTAAGLVLTALGAWVGHAVTSRTQARNTKVQAEANSASASDKLIDQLQEELGRYRDDNDARIGKLEAAVAALTEENRGYRSFIGIQRDHMAEHGIPLPPWPEGLPR